MRRRPRSGRHAAKRAATRAAAWFARPPRRIATVGALTVGVVAALTPATGAAGDITSHVVGALRQMTAGPARIAKPSASAQASQPIPAVGALFTSSNGKLRNHFCTASVVHSPGGDLAITAAHCLANVSGAIEFVPGYGSGQAPYGIWQVTKVYADQAWTASASVNDDVAFLQLRQPGSTVPIEDITGAETLGTHTSARQLVEVIGYPDTTELPVICENWTSQPMAEQLEFDCDGFTDGTSGGPLLAQVNAATGQGTVIGVIGGYQQGGFTPAVSYSIQFGPAVARLYASAVAGG